MVSPDFVHGIRKALEQNLNTHAAFSKPEKQCGFVTAVAEDGTLYYPEEYQISEDGSAVKGHKALFNDNEQTFPFVSVLTIDGPITRNGGGCSYGSIDHRDMMINAANHSLCRGHVFIINTPGGSAWAKNDYEQAISYARSLGQPVIAFIDGMCASAGMYLASLCDERYYMHPKNEVGCIGVMAAFYTEADGSVNQFSNETYHELYDPESFDKNKAFRDIANDGNTEELVNELATLGEEFRADVKKACPAATDEHLHGKVFNAEEVEGILVDGQATFLDVVQRAFALYEGAEPIKRETVEPEPEEISEPAQKPEKPEAHPEENNINKKVFDMKNYPLINTVCGLNEGELVVNEDGAFMNAALLDSIEGYMKTRESQACEAEQKVIEAKQTISEMQGKIDALTEQLSAAEEAKAVAEKSLAAEYEVHSKEIETLSAQNAEAIAERDAQIASLTSEKVNAEETLKGTQDALATAEQTIADKDAQIESLSEETGNEPETGDAPVNNGEGAKVNALREFDPSQYKTNVERKAAFEKFKRGE